MSETNLKNLTTADVLARPPYRGRLLIGGSWVDAADGATLERKSPAHDKVVAIYAKAGVVDAERAIAAARVAFDRGPWPQMKGAERARILRNVAEGILARKEELALMETLENGKPLVQSCAEIEGAADLWHYAATLARNLHGDSYNTLGEKTLGVVLRDPIGVVSIITPWNFPFLIVSQKLPFALAAGCTAVVKPAEVTSGTTVMLGEILVAAGVPAGVVNIVVGMGSVVGDALVTHPDVDMLSFTGSTLVGKQAVAKSAQTLKKVSMELGGKNPQIIFADCDWDAALDATVFGIYFNAGQCCNSGSRILVHESIADKFAAAVVERSKLVKVGDPLVPGVQVGAITTTKQLETILSHVDAARKAGIPIVYVNRKPDEPMGNGAYFVGSDSLVAGHLQMDYLAKELKGKGSIAIMLGELSTDATRDRTRGVKDIVAKNSGIKVVEEQTANFDRSQGINLSRAS